MEVERLNWDCMDCLRRVMGTVGIGCDFKVTFRHVGREAEENRKKYQDNKFYG
jgi:hypothetical protein